MKTHLIKNFFEENRKHSRRWSNLLPLLVTIIALIVVLYFIRWDDFSGQLDQLSFFWLLPALLFYLLFIFSRIIRIRILGSLDTVPISKLFIANNYYTFCKSILPMGFGEVSFVYFLKSIVEVEFNKGTSVWLIARLLDVVSFMLLYVLLQPFFIHQQIDIRLRLLTTSIAVGLILFFVAILFFAKKKAESTTGIPLTSPKGLIQKGRVFILKVVKSLNEILVRHILLRSLAISVLSWAIYFLVFMCIFKTIGIDISFQILVHFMLLAWIVEIIPIKGFANIGSYEAAIAASLVLLGINKSDALNAAIFSHILLFLIVTLFVIISAVLFRWQCLVAERQQDIE